jgi:hypothetical protein
MSLLMLLALPVATGQLDIAIWVILCLLALLAIGLDERPDLSGSRRARSGYEWTRPTGPHVEPGSPEDRRGRGASKT